MLIVSRMRCIVKAMHKRKAFTLIELIIVVVIIGILSGIGINIFRGVKEKAQNATFVSNVAKYDRALTGYHVDNGSYPAISTFFRRTCVGVGYEDVNGDGEGDCRITGLPTSSKAHFNDSLKPYFSEELPPVGNYITNIGPNDWQGLLFTYSSTTELDGVPLTEATILLYWLKGRDQKCHKGVQVQGVLDTGQPGDFTTGAGINSGSLGDGTRCAYIYEYIP